MEGFFIAQIMAFAGNFAPTGWAFCNGQLLNISSNTALFSLLGTTYGGNGTTTFGLPDLRGRTPIGVGQGPGLANVSWGEQAGSASIVLTSANIPAHTHTVAASVAVTDAVASIDEPANAILTMSDRVMYSQPAQANGFLAAGTLNTAPNTGGNAGFDNYKPYLGINYVICQQGIFPSRN